MQEAVPDARVGLAVSEALRSDHAVAGEGAASTVPLRVEDTERAYRLRTTPMRDPRGVLLGAVTLLQDVTHVREVDRSRPSSCPSRPTSCARRWRTLRMGVDLLLEGSAGPGRAAQAELATTATSEAARLERLLGELLDLSRLESGETAPRLAEVGAAALVRDAVEPLRLQVESKGLALRVDVPDTLPTVRADRAQVERVLANLVGNAVRATERGEIARVGRGPRRRGGGVRARHRARHPRRMAAARVRALRAGARRGGGWGGAGTGHLATHRARPWRAHRRPFRAGARLGVHVHAPDTSGLTE